MTKEMLALAEFRSNLADCAKAQSLELGDDAVNRFSAAFYVNCLRSGIPNKPTIEAAAKQAIEMLQTSEEQNDQR